MTLDPNDKIFADDTDGTPVITVKDKGGLNLDPYINYTDGQPDGFTYDKNYDTKDKTVEGGDLTFDDWSEWKPTGREWTDPDGTKHTEYIRTRDGEITDRITTQTDQAHKITFDNNDKPMEFTLIYDKTSTTVEPGREIKATDVMQNPSIVPSGTTPDDFYQKKDEKCTPAPEIDPDSYINQIKLPREIKEVSKISKVTDNTVDQSGNVMAAAAKVQIADENAENEDIDEDFEDIE